MTMALAAEPGIALEASDVWKAFGRTQALSGVAFSLAVGEIHALVGANGAGKSTFSRIVSGHVPADRGEIKLFGKASRFASARDAIRAGVAIVMQETSLAPDLSVLENMEFIAAIQGIPRGQTGARVDGLVARYGFEDRRRQLAGTMSGGWKQRLALACAVIHEPELLFLDEPTSAVDPESRRDFWENLFELADAGTTILVSTHLMDEAERCHRLAVLDRGRLVADGTPAELTGALAGRTLVIETDEPRRVRGTLQSLPGVLSAVQVGNSLRVLMQAAADAGRAEQRIDHALVQAGHRARVSAVSPNLEDVFVAATRGGADERTRAP